MACKPCAARAKAIRNKARKASVSTPKRRTVQSRSVRPRAINLKKR